MGTNTDMCIGLQRVQAVRVERSTRCGSVKYTERHRREHSKHANPPRHGLPLRRALDARPLRDLGPCSRPPTVATPGTLRLPVRIRVAADTRVPRVPPVDQITHRAVPMGLHLAAQLVAAALRYVVVCGRAHVQPGS